MFFEEEGDYITGENKATEDNKDTEVEFILVGGKKIGSKSRSLRTICC